jgi:alpha-aminoadipic semialdehyde synthase
VSAVSVRSQKRVLLFGAGRVAKPVLKLLDKHDNVHVTVASEDAKQGQELVDVMSGGGSKARFEPFRFPQDNNRLAQLIRDCDVAISLLPATMHLPLAEECINQRRHLVTASYVSPGNQSTVAVFV